MGEIDDKPVHQLDAAPDAAEQPGEPSPRRTRLGRGVRAARLLEATADLARRARSHAKPAARTKHRRKARRQLKKLIKALRSHQEQVLSKGLEASSKEALATALGDLDDTLQAFLDAKPDKKALKQVKKHAKRVRKGLLQ